VLIGDVGDAFSAMGQSKPLMSPIPPNFIHPKTVTLCLTPQENSIFSVLHEVGKSTGTQVRVAGGWVRDKLVGRISHDIDVCVDNMSGVEFAGHVNELLASRGELISTVGVIQANPEQSKHLETATVRVLDAWVDFVGLRAEVYDGDSRIPRTVVGTPVQDAMRRDFTLNSIFFNITHQCVEDFTGLGICDLLSSTLRTPLPPLLTFRDDPLRVLRAVRFSSRFSLHMVDDMVAAARDSAVFADLMAKVSRERVGIEVENMLGGAAPGRALRTLASLGLSPAVFSPPQLADIPLGGQLFVPSYSFPSSAGAGGGGGGEKTTTTTEEEDNAATCSILPFAQPGSLDGTSGLDSIPRGWISSGLDAVNALEKVASYLGTQALRDLLCLSSSSGGGGVGDREATEMSIHAVTAVTEQQVSNFPCFSPSSCPPLSPGSAAASLDGVFSSEDRLSLYFATQLSPLATINRLKPRGGGKGDLRAEPLVHSLLVEGLKRKKKQGDDVVVLFRGSLAFMELMRVRGTEGVPGRGMLPGPPPPLPHNSTAQRALAASLGCILRKECRELWRPSLLLALALLLQSQQSRLVNRGQCKDQGGSLVASPEFEGLCGRIHSVAHLIVAWELDGCWSWKPLLDGREMRSEVDGKLGGPALGAAIEAQAEWMILHPRGGREACIAHLKGLVATGAFSS